jgi:hypothetical protein
MKNSSSGPAISQDRSETLGRRLLPVGAGRNPRADQDCAECDVGYQSCVHGSSELQTDHGSMLLVM